MSADELAIMLDDLDDQIASLMDQVCELEERRETLLRKWQKASKG